MSDLTWAILVSTLIIMVGLLIIALWHAERKVKELERELKRWWRLDSLIKIRQSKEEEKK